MLTFNDLLALEGVSTARLRLARHQDLRLRRGALLAAWRSDRTRFERYQEVQKTGVFADASMVASFAVSETGSTVFVGIYEILGKGVCPEGSVDPLTAADVSGFVDYDLRPTDLLAEYADRLVIDWGAGTRAWVQRADKQSKRVLEIATQDEPRFPGFRQFVRPVDDIPNLPSGWQQVLRSVKGVYLLVDLDNGKQYVGSAKGADSLFGRWMSYVDGGDGGNRGLRAAGRAGRRRYQVSVLDVVDENTPDHTIEQVESYCKTKLMTREFGLNEG